ncbi:MAG: DNA gyrase inhibitor YacG [Planctomycetota bacterium]|nr:MAG: DNA gyrase inhibitor YacG [Planctomycetota bacterium]
MDASNPCPQCGALVPLAREQRPGTFPFCSERCRTLDLGAWADESFVVPGRSLTMDMEQLEEDPLEALRQRARQFQRGGR